MQDKICEINHMKNIPVTEGIFKSNKNVLEKLTLKRTPLTVPHLKF